MGAIDEEGFSHPVFPLESSAAEVAEIAKQKILEEMVRLELAMPPNFSAADLIQPDFSDLQGEHNQKYFQHEAKGGVLLSW